LRKGTVESRGDVGQAIGQRSVEIEYDGLRQTVWVCGHHAPARVRATTPGSSRPSSHSRKAPPAVET
jgi:hypothetical protein